MEELFYWFYRGSEYRWVIIIILALIATVMGLWIYLNIYHLGILQSLSYTAQLFTIDVKTPFELKELLVDRLDSASIVDMAGVRNQTIENSEYWYTIYIANIIATLAVGMSIFLLFFRGALSHVYRWKIIRNGNHTIVIGLGRNSRFFINSMLEEQEKHENKEMSKHSIIAFEIDKENPFLEIYEKKRLAIIIAEIDNVIDSLNLDNCKNIFISTGNDQQNIYYALLFLDRLKGNKNFNKLLVHIEDRTLRNFYSDTGLLNDCQIDMKVFSFFKESARMLFQEHSLDGDTNELMDSQDAFGIILIGDDDLTISLIIEACKLAHYPKLNPLTIHCISKDKQQLKEKIFYAFPEIKNDKILTISLNYIELDSNRVSFYSNEIWKNTTCIKHIIYCFNDVMQNIKIATKVKDRIFLRREEEFNKIKFHLGSMNQKKIAKEIKELKRDNLFVFAQAEKVCSYKNLLDNEIDKIAKWINYDYYLESKKEDKKIEDIEELWRKTSINDKKSSLGQAIHIKTKLKYLRLEKRDDKRANKNENETLINKVLEIRSRENILEKLAITEHNRWMALLKLMDYQYADICKKDKKQKLHPLLKPWDQLTQNEQKQHIQFNLNSINQIAKYATRLNKIIQFRNLIHKW